MCNVRADGIRLPPTFFDQMVIKQTHRNEPLLQGGVGEPYAGIDSDNVRAAAIWSRQNALS